MKPVHKYLLLVQIMLIASLFKSKGRSQEARILLKRKRFGIFHGFCIVAGGTIPRGLFATIVKPLEEGSHHNNGGEGFGAIQANASFYFL